MSNLKIYQKIVVFVLPRILCQAVALFASTLVLVGIAVPAYKHGCSQFVLVLIIIVAVIIWYFISSFMKFPYQSAAISLITKACNGQIISNHPYNEGLNDVKKRFGVTSTSGLAVSLIKFIFDKDKTKEDKNRIIYDVKTFISFYVVNLIPYFNTCLLSIVMFYKDKSYSECIFETLEVTRKNLGRIIMKTIGIFFLFSFLPIIAFFAICILLAGFLFDVSSITSSNLMLMRILGFGDNIAYFNVVIVSVLFGIVVYLFVSPNATIRVVRFFNELDKNTILEHKLYNKFMEKTQKNKFLRRIKEADDSIKQGNADE